MGAEPGRRRSKALLEWRMAPYGVDLATTTRTSRRGRRPSTTRRSRRSQCPTLVLDPDHEQFWPGQSKQFFDALTCEKQLARFVTEDGADWHCEPAAQSLRDERVFDFLETVFASSASAAEVATDDGRAHRQRRDVAAIGDVGTNAWNAGTSCSESAFGTSCSITTCTKLTPSSSRNTW